MKNNYRILIVEDESIKREAMLFKAIIDQDEVSFDV
jgi:hypothetical protein